VAEVKPAEAVDPKPAEEDGAKLDGTAETDKPAGAEAADAKLATGDKKPVKPADKRPAVATIKPDSDTPPKVAAPVKPSTNTNSSAKVDNLLAQLDSGKPAVAPANTGGDSSLPDKLSAASVRSAIRGRFDV